MTFLRILGASLLLSLAACGDSATDRGVGSECATSDDCTEEGQTCLAFRGGYCGLTGCTMDEDCPVGAACMMRGDAINSCSRTYAVKHDCNANGTEATEATCSSTAMCVEGAMGRKACTPPSSS